jgi:hypothetical protein
LLVVDEGEMADHEPGRVLHGHAAVAPRTPGGERGVAWEELLEPVGMEARFAPEHGLARGSVERNLDARDDAAALPERERAEVSAAARQLREERVRDAERLREGAHQAFEEAFADLGLDGLGERSEQAVAHRRRV